MMFAGGASKGAQLPDPGKCFPNVRDFVQTHGDDAQRIAQALGNDVTPTEVLATAGNETQWGDLTKGLAQYGNFFGLHGSGPAGTYYTKLNHTPTAKFPVDQGFAQSGAVFARKEAPVMTRGLGLRPPDFFSVLNKNGYATGNPNYPAIMTNTASGHRGAYTLARACTRQR
jgi:hypothetical protein